MADYLRHLTARIRMLYLSRSFPRFRRAALKYSCAASSQNGLSRSGVPVNIMVMSAKRISIQFRYLARVSQQIMRAFVKAGKINVYCQYSHIDSINQSSDEFRRIAKIITRHDLAKYFRLRRFQRRRKSLLIGDERRSSRAILDSRRDRDHPGL